MMNLYALPTTLNVNGTDWDIRTDFRAIIDIMIALSDPDLDDYEKQEVMFEIMYPDYDLIPTKDIPAACKAAVEFIDYNLPAGKPKPRTMDWEQDAPLILPAVNKVAGMEVRTVKEMHWWTFLGYFMEIEDGTFSQVLSIRQKKSRGKKLEKWEKEFERDNPDLVKLQKKHSEQQKKEMDALEKWL